MTHNRFRRPALAGLLFLLLAGAARAAFLDTAIDFTGFTGAGFAPAPAPGQLDSDAWQVEGLSDGDLLFGGEQAAGDFARGQSAGGVATGGLYAFDTGGGNTILGVQPTGTDFTPGSFTLRLRNGTGAAVSGVDVRYDVYIYNDQDRSAALSFAYSTDGVAFTPVPAADLLTAEAAALSPSWELVTRTLTLELAIPVDGLLYLRWSGDDAGGSGSRDEYGLDEIQVTALAPTAVTLAGLTAGVARSGQLSMGQLEGAALLTGGTLFLLRRRRRRGGAHRVRPEGGTM